MGNTYLDTPTGLVQVDIQESVNPEFAGIITFVKDAENQIINNPELIETFEEIFNNFDIKNPLKNDLIIKQYKGGKKFYFFLNFCNYLIEKIKTSENDKQISKVPLIVSNLANYKGKYPNQKTIINKRGEVMLYFNNKMKKNKSFSKGIGKIDPWKLY